MLQAVSDGIGIRMGLVELYLYEPVLTEDQATWQAENIFDQSQGAKTREWCRKRHPELGPCQQVVSKIDRQDEGLLSSQVLFASSFEFQAHFVGLNLGFTSAAIIVAANDLALFPFCDRADHGADLGLPGLG